MKATTLLNRFYPKPSATVSLHSLASSEIRRFLRESELTFCELLILARGTQGSERLLHERLEMIGLNVNDIDLTALSNLPNSPARLEIAPCALPAAWPSAA